MAWASAHATYGTSNIFLYVRNALPGILPIHMRYASLILMLLLAAPLLAEQVSGQPNLVPVKAELLDGTRLVLKSAGCSFDLPAAGWKWMIFDGNAGQNFHCFNASTQANFLIAVGHFHGDFSDEQP